MFRALWFIRGALRVSREMHGKLFRAITRAPMGFFDTTPLGRILNRFSSGMKEVRF